MNMSLVGKRGQERVHLGTMGHLGLFLWSLGMVLLSSQSKVPVSAGICLIVLCFIYPGVWKRAIQIRRLVLLGLMVLPPILFYGEPEQSILGIVVSPAGIRLSALIAMRFVVIMVALEGLTNAVEISALAGVLERFGMKGLGFSMGVALNLLPCLRSSCIQTWQSLRMKGGLRKKWWQGLKLYALTVVTNALSKAEEIAQAAEARAFSPERSRSMPIEKSRLDFVLLPISALSFVLLVWVV